jgi:hypothetical protein
MRQTAVRIHGRPQVLRGQASGEMQGVEVEIGVWGEMSQPLEVRAAAERGVSLAVGAQQWERREEQKTHWE